MKAASLIHTRTLHCDFNPNFLARPLDFSNSEVEWVRKYILDATSDIDNLHGERWIIISNNKYKVAGVVCVTKDFFANTASSEDSIYLKDERSRGIYAFIGIVFKPDSEHNSCISLSCETLFDLFKKHVVPVWERTVVETSLCDYEDVDLPLVDHRNPEVSSFNINGREIYNSSKLSDKELFNYFLNCNNDDFSFCTNISNLKTAKETPFKCITVSGNISQRLQIENISNEASANSLVSINDQTLNEHCSSNEANDLKKKLPNPWILLLASLLIIMVLIFLLIL